MKNSNLLNLLLKMFFLIIIVQLISCNTDYKKSLQGLWKLEKFETILSGNKVTVNPDVPIYYEFKPIIGVDIVKYNNILGEREAYSYKLENNIFTTNYLKTGTSDNKNIDTVNYTIKELNDTHLSFELKIPDGSNINLSYYCLKVKNEKQILDYLDIKNKEWDEEGNFIEFKSGFQENNRNIYKGIEYPDSIYDNFLHCIYDYIQGDKSPLNNDEKSQLEKGTASPLLLKKLKMKDAECFKLLKNYIAKKEN